jgi:hypothetical protein
MNVAIFPVCERTFFRKVSLYMGNLAMHLKYGNILKVFRFLDGRWYDRMVVSISRFQSGLNIFVNAINFEWNFIHPQNNGGGSVRISARTLAHRGISQSFKTSSGILTPLHQSVSFQIYSKSPLINHYHSTLHCVRFSAVKNFPFPKATQDLMVISGKRGFKIHSFGRKMSCD